MAGYCGLEGLFEEELLNGQLKIGKKYDKQWLLFDQSQPLFLLNPS
jgi:hypothetical protein